MTKANPKPGATIVFDLDGTLVDSAHDLIATLNRVIEEEGVPPLSTDHVGHLVGQGALKMLDKAYAYCGKTLDTDLRAALHQKFLALYDSHIADQTRPFDGVLDVLDNLKAEGWLLAVCTNKYEGMSKKLLKLLEMDTYFEAICGSDTFPVRKPDPKHLWATIEEAGGVNHRSIMVGDSATDVNTAKAANIPIIGVPFGYTDVPMEELAPTKLVSHYRDMKATITEIATAFD
ncbi:MAG: HAD-IA family hydrolase [Pseudomonadota bacterium]